MIYFNKRGLLIVICFLFPFISIAQQKPNVVIIYADDMGYGDLAALNSNSKIKTPNLDKLAKEGTLFTNAHSSSGICTPSRYAMLTGKYHWRTFHKIIDSWEPPVFLPNDITIAKMLSQNGYQTACIGKWHLGWDWNSIKQNETASIIINNKKTYLTEAFDWNKPVLGGPLNQGFDYYFGDDVPNFPPYTWIRNNKILIKPDTFLNIVDDALEGKWEARPGPAVKDWKFDQVMPTITADAVSWIKNQDKNKPFFLYFSLTAPHAPIVPTKEWVGKSNAGPYGDFMMQSDWSAGEILKAIEEAGFKENTIIIFSSDNGPENYAFNRVKNFNHYSMGELRGVKRDVWEGGHRVPLIIRWPGKVKEGRITNGLISQIDILATLSAIVNQQAPPSAIDSYNQLKFITGGKSKRPMMVHNTSTKYAIQHKDWVYIDANNGEHSKMPDWFSSTKGYKIDDNEFALYNLKRDLSQHENLIKIKPKKAINLRFMLYEITGKTLTE
ncbi:arylsulfatase [Pedobacter glucosidilyticus]|nr:arylsulfatase [Pedobacter glucosidilyticus]KHJ39442.1 arylsulfatase [Pedobacter glucosidilyticus]